MSANCLFLFINWGFSFWRYALSPDFIPLHYNIYFGFDRFGPRGDIFLFPSLATVVLLVNLLIVGRVFGRDNFWTLVFLGLTLFLQAVFLGSLLLVTLKNIS